MPQFQLISDFQPAGDQPQAIDALVRGIEESKRSQVLLGVTGSGKTFTMANVIARLNRPTLVLSHNKTLAAQLYGEFREFFPHNAVTYFVSYYDYYQPEAYIPQRDIYIEKDASINEEIDRLRLLATSALVSRRDVVVVASVSCIYGLGSPKDYLEMMVPLRVGGQIVEAVDVFVGGRAGPNPRAAVKVFEDVPCDGLHEVLERIAPYATGSRTRGEARTASNPAPPVTDARVR